MLFAAASSNSQIAVTPDTPHPESVAAAESSSSAPTLFNETVSSADPAAPDPASGASAGQYDNKGGDRARGLKSRVTFEAGGGFNGPSGDSASYITWGGQLALGGGLRLSRSVSVLAEYQFIEDKLPGALIAETGASGGNAHIWSLTLAPVIDLMPNKATGVYVTGGGGFYRKVTNFTDPQPMEYCTYFYCGIAYSNVTVGHFSSNQGGWNAGGGVRHRFAGFYNEGKLEVFAEARYLDVMTPAVSSSPNGLGVATVGAETKLIPVTFGVRF